MPTRVVTYGQQPTTAPPGTFRAINFPMLAPLDEGTKEGFISRKLSSDGGRARDGMPLTISMQYVDDVGHMRSVPVGALHEIFFDGENKVVSGKGWLADTPDGHLAEIVVLSKALNHNSVDLGEISPDGVEIVEHGDFWDDDFWMEVIFKDYAVAKTTLVATPAFAKAHGSLPDDEVRAAFRASFTDNPVRWGFSPTEAEEIKAALESDEPLVVDCPSLFSGHTPTEEIMAGATALPSWDYFNRAEADIPHKIIVGTPDADGWIPVYGHLAKWDTPHRGYDGRTVYAPRPRNAYREFNQPSVLTDRGQVEAGPIVLYGGHVSLRDAANDPRNAWCDVKVTAGKHGPWVCGVVRPHVAVDDAHTYVARASRISGHWKGDDLCMIVSCNSEGFNIPGIGFDALEPGELVAAFTPGSEDEIVAGFDVAEIVPIPAELFSFTELTTEAQARVLKWAQSGNFNSYTNDGGQTPGEILTTIIDEAAAAEPEVDPDQEARDAAVAEFLASEGVEV